MKGKSQIKSNAERQAAYRARHLKHEDGEGVRLNVVIHFRAKFALERLASCYGVTQAAMLERLIQEGQRAAQEEVAKMGPHGQDAYYDGKLKLPEADVTP
jgi:hypothetical protein